MNKYDLTFGPFQYPDMDKSKMEANFYGRFADYLIQKGFIPSLVGLCRPQYEGLKGPENSIYGFENRTLLHQLRRI